MPEIRSDLLSFVLGLFIIELLVNGVEHKRNSLSGLAMRTDCGSSPPTVVRVPVVLSYVCHGEVIILQQNALLFAQKSYFKQ